jgi:hypothetical protein
MSDSCLPMLLSCPVDGWAAVGLRIDRRARSESLIDRLEALIDRRRPQTIGPVAIGELAEVVGGEVVDTCRLDDRPGLGAPRDQQVHDLGKAEGGGGAIRDALHPRRCGLKNRERTNRLLLLAQLHANGQDEVLAYTKSIRTWLETNGGRPDARRRALTDRAGRPSVR